MTAVNERRERRPGVRLDRTAEATLDVGALVEVRAALAAGAAPTAALAAAREGPLARPAAAARLGRSLAEIAAEVDTGDARADLLVRALAVAELVGAGAAEGVDQALHAAEQEAAVRRSLRVRSTQARLTAVLLTAMPALLWALFVVTNPAMLRFYLRPLGAATGAAAVALAAAGQWWSRRVVAGAARAVAAADPLVPAAPGRDVARALVLGLPALAVGAAAGPAVAFPAAAAGALIGLRGTRAARAARRQARAAADAAASGGGAEAIELLATALSAGAAPVGAAAIVAPVAPPLARPALQTASRRLRGGWSPAEAFAGTGLDALGVVLDSTSRWGAPAEVALRRLADELRAVRRAAADEAAERTQIALVFPTTLLTLPAFVLAVVPPLVWTAFAAG